jgi:hypothetical protein
MHIYEEDDRNTNKPQKFDNQIGEEIKRSDGHYFYLLKYPRETYMIRAGCQYHDFELYYESLEILREFEKRANLTFLQKLFTLHRPWIIPTLKRKVLGN